MRKTVAAVIFSLFFTCLLYGQTGYWQQQVNYLIDVKLDDVSNSLDGYVKMDYQNNSPDTLTFIWIHCWPNAYKNDLTAFSDQLLRNGNTDFYFADAEARGYMNRLNFKVNGTIVAMENHPEHQDIIKIILPAPLAPHSSCKIETPFHVKLPYNISRGGHNGQSYQITQWYPKPAVFDRKGWHPMPYLDQGEFYSEFGDYKVQISLPKNYVVAATGVMESSSLEVFEAAMAPAQKKEITFKKKMFASKNKVVEKVSIPSSSTIQTFVYTQKNVHDFVWFADKQFIKAEDTLALPSGRVIKAAVYYLPGKAAAYWDLGIKYLKKAILSRSNLLGEYPYDNVSVAEGNVNYAGGMEYPTITLISGIETEVQLEQLIEHEVGHNWLYGILASNEREHPWMDEGMNTYYGTRYWNGGRDINIRKKIEPNFIAEKMPENLNFFAMRNQIALKKDQPIETASENIAGNNYDISAYHKPSRWMKLLETRLGQKLFDSAMHRYYEQWKFKHPYPEDFKQVIETVSGQNLDNDFALLNKKGDLPQASFKRPFKLAPFFNFKETEKYKYIFLAPAIGYNYYDGFMIGAIAHNYTLPAEKFQFLVSGLYGTSSKKINGVARISYTVTPGSNGQQLIFSAAGSKFTGDEFTDSTGTKNYQPFSKIVPSIKYVLPNKNPLSSVIKYLQWKTFFITEQSLLFTRDTVLQADNISYPVVSRYLNQLQFSIENSRLLYPYKAQLMLEQGKDFARLGFTGNYFFNYVKGGGLDVRIFAGKFFYPGGKTSLKQAQTDAYQLNMTGPKGYEDYSYSNYFIGRNEFEGWTSQQIMQRDGFFKVRTDFLSSKVGKSDDWLTAANFVTSIPDKINPLEVLPIKIPLKFFVDVGTYAEAWKKNANQGKFIFDAGLQISVFKNGLNIYVPLFYSRVYGDYFKSTINEHRFLKNISFSIDLQNITLKKLIPQLAY